MFFKWIYFELKHNIKLNLHFFTTQSDLNCFVQIYYVPSVRSVHAYLFLIILCETKHVLI